MKGLIDKLLRAAGATRSKDDAKSRLKVLLIHDQVDLTPAQMEKMQDEIMDVISRYVEVDDDNVEFRLDKEEDGVALVSSVPVRKVTARAT